MAGESQANLGLVGLFLAGQPLLEEAHHPVSCRRTSILEEIKHEVEGEERHGCCQRADVGRPHTSHQRVGSQDKTQHRVMGGALTTLMPGLPPPLRLHSSPILCPPT
jgi:hypothetical protein